MDFYKDPDQCNATRDLLAFSQEKDSIVEEPLQSDVFTDPEFSYIEQCEYFLHCSYHLLLQHQWYQLAKIFCDHLEFDISLSCLCVVLRYLSSKEKRQVLPLNRITDAISQRQPNEITLTLASEIADVLSFPLMSKDDILRHTSSELGEFWVLVMRSEYLMLEGSLTDRDFERLLPFDGRSMSYKAAVLNLFKSAMKDFPYCRDIFIQEIFERLVVEEYN
jgi:hypothetical protein